MRYIYLLFFLSYSSLSFSQGPFTCEGQMYITLSSGQPSKIYEVIINTSNNVEFVPLGPGNCGEFINALGYRSLDNYMYAIDPTSFEFFQIGNTGLATQIAQLNLNNNFGYYGAAIHPDGQQMIFIGSNSSFRSVELAFMDFSTLSIVKTVELSSASTGNLPNVLCTDIAFDPLTGEVYGFDRINRRLIRIDIETGIVEDDLYPITENAFAMGGVFFDSFGGLFGYDRPFTGANFNTLFRVNKITGEITAIADGPVATDKDGCACPYTIELQKSVFPTVTYPCTEVLYSFILSNASGVTQNGIYFEDYMPDGFTITEILQNPFNGNILSGIGSNELVIENMTVPVGINTIIVRVEIGENLEGFYQNQAMVSGLPNTLGEFTISDNPTTIVQDDSTTLEVLPLFIELGSDSTQLCNNETLIFDAEGLVNVPLTYNWNTGATTPSIEIDEEGFYSVTVTSGCETVTDNIYVAGSDIDLELGGIIEIELGDSVIIFPTINSPTDVNYTWTPPIDNSLSCLDCENPTAQPFFDITYYLDIINLNGCIDTDSIQFRVLKNRNVFIPNVFSPDFDGINDYFFIHTKRDEKILQMNIFDRWGNMVFEKNNFLSNDPQQGWDGTFRNKKMNPAVFVYQVEIEYLDGYTEMLYGDVTLLR